MKSDLLYRGLLGDLGSFLFFPELGQRVFSPPLAGHFRFRKAELVKRS